MPNTTAYCSQVTAGIDDYTYLTRSSTEDPHLRADNWSGARGHGPCLLVGHMVSLLGRFIALRPPGIGATPRGSDTAAMAVQVPCGAQCNATDAGVDLQQTQKCPSRWRMQQEPLSGRASCD